MATVKELKTEFKYTRTGDAWGETMGAFFDLAEYLFFRRENCPAAWQYKPGAAATDVDAENYWLELFEETETDALVRFGNILERHARRVRHAGLDY